MITATESSSRVGDTALPANRRSERSITETGRNEGAIADAGEIVRVFRGIRAFAGSVPEEEKELSREVENLLSDFRGLPGNTGRSRRRKTQELGPLIEELLVKYRISHDSLEHSIREKWSGLVGVANASYSHPLVVERAQLVVLVSHSVVRNELFHHRMQILERVRKLPGCAGIKGLNLRTG